MTTLREKKMKKLFRINGKEITRRGIKKEFREQLIKILSKRFYK
ncbi:hypothetical protein ES703_105768 [subsurface metagenome]